MKKSVILGAVVVLFGLMAAFQLSRQSSVEKPFDSEHPVLAFVKHPAPAKCGSGKADKSETPSDTTRRAKKSKCGSGKCGSGKSDTQKPTPDRDDDQPATQDKKSKCGSGKCGSGN